MKNFANDDKDGVWESFTQSDSEDEVWESFTQSDNDKNVNSDDGVWEEAEFLDSSASDQLKEKCHDTFPQDQIDNFENYTILEELGRGRMGIVYKAINKIDKKLYAIKILPEKVINNPKAVNQFFQEICIHNSLKHDNIIHLHKIGVCKETVFIVMEYVAGCDLNTMLNQKGPFSEFKTLKLFTPILEALDHAHSLNVIHRDLKPANILIQESSNRPKVADFGLARVITEKLASDEAFGTPAYMAPEQIVSNKKIDIRADIYAAGSILYHMLTGNRPYYHLETPSLLLKAKLKQDPQKIEDIFPEINDKLRIIVTKALSRKPKNRFQKPQEFLAQIKDVFEKVKKEHSKNKVVTDFEDINSASQIIAFQPKQDEQVLMTASRYDVDPVIETFQSEIQNFNNSPVGNLIAEETKLGESEFEETLLSITMEASAGLDIPPKLLKQILKFDKTDDILKNVTAFLKTVKLNSKDKKIVQELKYLILLRANALNKKALLLNFINNGVSLVNIKLDELSNISRNNSLNRKIRKYLKSLIDKSLKNFHNVFIEDIRACKDFDEIDCYLHNYPVNTKDLLKKYKKLQLITKTKLLRKKLKENPDKIDKLLDKCLGKEVTTLHTKFKKLNNNRDDTNNLWNAINRSKNLKELLSHLKRFGENPKLKKITSKIYELLNIFIGVGGYMSLKQFKTSINFLPQQQVFKICQLVKKHLKAELEKKIQLISSGNQPARNFSSLLSLLRNPRYDQGITLYGYEVKNLVQKISELQTNPDSKESKILKEKLPGQLLRLIYCDDDTHLTFRVKNIKNCLTRLQEIKNDYKNNKVKNLLKELVNLFNIYGKLNFAKEDSIYAIDGFYVARTVIHHYSTQKSDVELPDKLRDDIAVLVKELILMDRKK